ncbi:LysE family translocator [Vibrio sp. 99-70-13A1]|uniref:LysE family translocator n=1 Tax=Vibrio sp. 99-70-13A1 TaxID=2607601 RepID=UPI001493785F|nr:LysE family translocator [Vibrio sp. 99-70-13A1]NOH98950.1 LysE family translocator [Vibrio sp. 99-70-13A1]
MAILNIEAFLIAITILTLTPGLDTALVIRNTTRSGVKDGAITSLGVCLGLFVHATFSAIGISAILLQSAELFQIIKFVGAAYLIWLGLSSIYGVVKGSAGFQVEGIVHSNLSVKRSLREGFLSNVLNPKTAVFYLAFLPQFIDPEGSAFAQSMLMASIHFIIAMIWQCGISGAVNSAKQLFKSPSVIGWMEGVTGAVLITLGIKLMLEDAPTAA